MSVQDLGSMGELIGALAVLVTLIYLSIQTRLTRKAAQESAKFALAEATRAITQIYAKYRTFMTTPVLAEIVVKARVEPLNDKEQLMFSAVFEELFFVASCAYQSSFTGATLVDPGANLEHVVDVIHANPLALEVWKTQHSVLAKNSPDFVAKADEMLLKDVS